MSTTTRSYYVAATIAGAVKTYESTSAQAVGSVAAAWKRRSNDVRADVLYHDETGMLGTITVPVTTARGTAQALARA